MVKAVQQEAVQQEAVKLVLFCDKEIIELL